MLTSWQRRPADAVAIRQAARMPCAILVAGDGMLSPELRRELQDQGFVWMEATTIREALACQHREPCSIVISAERLPDGTGAQLVDAIRAAAHSAYVYAILRAPMTGSSGRSFDQIVPPHAGAGELLRALRAARRIVTLERVWRIDSRGTHESALVEQVSGRYAGLYFLNELLHHVEQLRDASQGLGLLLLRVEPARAADAILRPIVASLFGVVATDADVIARLSESTFGLLLDTTSRPAAEAAGRHLRATLAGRIPRDGVPRADVHCAVAVLNGPVLDAGAQALGLMQEAEAQLPAGAPATAASIDFARDALASTGVASGGSY